MVGFAYSKAEAVRKPTGLADCSTANTSNMNTHTFQHWLTLGWTLAVSCFWSCASDDPVSLEDDLTLLPAEEYTYSPIEYRKRQSGNFYDWSSADSKETRTIDGMNWFTPDEGIRRTAWGGRTGVELATVAGKPGFFHVARCGERFYLADPDGGADILHGIQHVRPGDSEPHRQGFAQRFGSLSQWSEETGTLIADNHINYISYGSSSIEPFPAELREALLSPKTQKIAYGENLYLLRSFMWDMKKNLGYAFEDDKYNRLVLLFEPTFAAYIDQLAREKCADFVNDCHFVGYYLDNELPFASYEDKDARLGVDLKHFLALPDRYRAARSFAEAFMAEHHLSAAGITQADNEAFRNAVADYYYRLATETVRRHDGNHLILGTRLHDWSKYNQGVVEACARYCDVVSINYYARWQPEADFLAKLKAWCGDKPFLVSEFYVKAANATYGQTPYTNTEGGGWMVRTQKDRGIFHQNFCLRLLEAKNCIGWVHFEYNDGYTEEGASNKGIVSLNYEPYTDFLSAIRQINLDVYSLIDYYDKESN